MSKIINSIPEDDRESKEKIISYLSNPDNEWDEEIIKWVGPLINILENSEDINCFKALVKCVTEEGGLIKECNLSQETIDATLSSTAPSLNETDTSAEEVVEAGSSEGATPSDAGATPSTTEEVVEAGSSEGAAEDGSRIEAAATPSTTEDESSSQEAETEDGSSEDEGTEAAAHAQVVEVPTAEDGAATTRSPDATPVPEADTEDETEISDEQADELFEQHRLASELLEKYNNELEVFINKKEEYGQPDFYQGFITEITQMMKIRLLKTKTK